MSESCFSRDQHPELSDTKADETLWLPSDSHPRRRFVHGVFSLFVVLLLVLLLCSALLNFTAGGNRASGTPQRSSNVKQKLQRLACLGWRARAREADAS